MLELRQLECFVAVAETEHVGRAAERLRISQSPLSRRIADLERRLGLVLFERSRQRVRLTADGEVFLSEARALLRHAERLESLGQRLGRGETGGLCLGYVEHAIHADVLPGALRSLRRDRPDVHVSLHNQTGAEQLEALRRRSLDVALVDAPPAEDDPVLESELVLRDPLVLALPADHPLASRERIQPSDLDDQPWIAIGREDAGEEFREFLSSCAAEGFTPSVRTVAPEPLAALGLVASGLGMALLQRSALRGTPPDVVLRELPWCDSSVRLWAAWHHIDLRPLVAEFRKVLLDGTAAR
ncbi:LysR family transcriptional regulator [Actinopolyspora erythraea]|uniref:LysR family transcriptional regulator n=1 Tax=Actinopolyspora erythraea TaxID=414996 RepID=A0A099D599_9ACTN|nr:LysR family transcriptional regulator [Actinopolyspora erythraea]ASU78841.1 LysR family transcriptional regulator [Actinopolyspora erythraea]KGI81358.1 LysR family transcriptional regulator [Actinopolyspora erythraea]